MEIKTRKALLIVAGLSVFMLSACNGTTTNLDSGVETCDIDEMEGYTKYSDFFEDFQFQYPEDWTMEEDTGDIYLTVMSPLLDDDDFLMEGMNIIIDDLPGVEADDDLAEAVDLAIEGLEDEMDEFVLESREETKLSGVNAERIEYTWEMDGIEVFMIQVIAVSPELEKQYVLTFSNFEDGYAFDEWNDIFEEIIDSFCFEEGILD